MPPTTIQVPLATWLREQLPIRRIESICDELGLQGIGEGHLLDMSTMVELDAKGVVVTVGGVRPPTPKPRPVIEDE